MVSLLFHLISCFRVCASYSLPLSLPLLPNLSFCVSLPLCLPVSLSSPIPVFFLSFSLSPPPPRPIFIKSSQRSDTLLSLKKFLLTARLPLLRCLRVYSRRQCHQFIPQHGQYFERTFRALVTRARAHTHAHVNRARATLPVVLCRNSTHFLQLLARASLRKRDWCY